MYIKNVQNQFRRAQNNPFLYPKQEDYVHQIARSNPFINTHKTFARVDETVQIPMEGLWKEVSTAIYEAIIGEATAIDFYTRLVQEAPDRRHKADIQHALEDEKKHLKKFTNLFTALTGQRPQYSIEPVQFESYKEGLEMAYRDELEAYENYRDAYLFTQNQTIRDAFLLGYTDEIEHALKFGFLLQTL
ncbi:ferritin-like domain-containing protein [Chengkuizengella axinellae]|uniref:Ferritin-like domain-containing protein n=1 Tax=Chengkuizengella axinellae TaxID=3064388 RepID=A0ABT9IZZ0_9BACL|nr:ferritin-like domain-containing protein [Chengkuizengella sp. 2205SS18-9]MDP5274320.1 ferritin-like domain-containing protein [Chengkuizengella sp. 2205SS18-9]